MKTPAISFLFFIIILFSSCFPSDVRFIDAQPEHLEELSFIPNQFQGIFVINNDTFLLMYRTTNIKCVPEIFTGTKMASNLKRSPPDAFFENLLLYL